MFRNIIIGVNTATTLYGNENIFIGNDIAPVLTNITPTFNLVIGNYAFQSFQNGMNNTIVGMSSCTSATSVSNCVQIGESAGRNLTSGSYNTMIGTHAGAGVAPYSASSCVLIGNSAGYHNTTSNRLYISNWSARHPLIYGEFDIDPANALLVFNCKSIAVSDGNIGPGVIGPYLIDGAISWTCDGGNTVASTYSYYISGHSVTILLNTWSRTFAALFAPYITLPTAIQPLSLTSQNIPIQALSNGVNISALANINATQLTITTTTGAALASGVSGINLIMTITYLIL